MAATLEKSNNIPAYRPRKGYSQAIVTLTDAVTGKRKDYWLGEHGTPASYEAYHRILVEWESGGRRLPSPVPEITRSNGHLSIGAVIDAYQKYVETTYKRPSQQTIFMVLSLLRRFHGTTPAEDFGPKRLRELREQMIRGDLNGDPPRKPWSRTTINKAMHQIAALFKWAASNEMISATIYQHLKTLSALRRGLSLATEPKPVRPVPMEVVAATKKHLSRQVKALLDLQLCTGARGGELFDLRPMDLEIDKKKRIWLVRPSEHKTAHHGHDRVIYLGPKAQASLKPFLVNRPADRYLFSPREAEAERRLKAAGRRKTPLKYGNGNGTNRIDNPQWKPGDRYNAASYRCAIGRACERAGVQSWHPHQLRHTAATIIRRDFGLETARIILGHSSAMVTDAVYAQRDMERVVHVMRKIG